MWEYCQRKAVISIGLPEPEAHESQDYVISPQSSVSSDLLIIRKSIPTRLTSEPWAWADPLTLLLYGI